MLKRVYKGFFDFIERERSQRALWYPVLVGIGILAYYGGALSYLLLAFLVPVLRYRTCFILIGLLAMHFRISTINTTLLTEPIYLHRATAVVQQINYKEKSVQLILRNLEHKRAANLTKVRLRTYHLDDGIRAGDRVLFSAKLLPPPTQPSPYGYNFADFAYFEGISAVGFITNIKLLESGSHTFTAYIDIIRNYIAKEFIDMMGDRNGNIAAALLVGKREGIALEVMNDIRKAGIAHLLAISGLHLSVVAFSFFVMVRKSLALSIFIATKYNIKKWAALCGLICSSGYLVLSGMPISAQRSFIMVAIVLLAILLDRNSSTMRSIAVAAFIILLMEPEALFKPSFQMSFAAVTALCAFFEARHVIYVHNLFYRIFDYFKAIILSSLVAGLATTPYTIYHFNYFSLGGLISNLLAIPITTTLILPSGIISVFLMSIGLADVPAFFMSRGIDLIVAIASYVADSDYASIPVKTFDHLSILIITSGFLWLCLWQQQWRFYGNLIIIVGLVMGLNYQTADIWLNDKMAAIKGQDGKLYFLNKQRKNFVSKAWITQNGQQEILFYPSHSNNESVSILCQENYCQYNHHNKSVLFLYGPTKLSFEAFDYIIQVRDFPILDNDKIIPYSKINKGYFLWLQNGQSLDLSASKP